MLRASECAPPDEYVDYTFFPLNGKGFNDHISKVEWATNANHLWSCTWDNNYLFSTEIGFNFTYQGGEMFQFFGDDDVWFAGCLDITHRPIHAHVEGVAHMYVLRSWPPCAGFSSMECS